MRDHARGRRRLASAGERGPGRDVAVRLSRRGRESSCTRKRSSATACPSPNYCMTTYRLPGRVPARTKLLPEQGASYFGLLKAATPRLWVDRRNPTCVRVSSRINNSCNVCRSHRHWIHATDARNNNRHNVNQTYALYTSMTLVFQRPATTHELLLGDATGELAESAVWLHAGEAVEMSKQSVVKEPLPVSAANGCGGGGGGGMDSSCSSLLVSPPPPMRALLPSGGQSSAYAALKAMNPCDLQAGAHLVRTDKKGAEPLFTSSSAKHFSLFPGAAPTSTEMCRPSAPPQGPSSLPIPSATERQSAAAAAAERGPASLDSKIITAAEVRQQQIVKYT